MRKTVSSALFVGFVGFATTSCATGGYLGSNPYPGPLGQVMASNLALTCPGDYYVGPPINRCLRSLGGDMGRYSSYTMYRGGAGGPQLSQADKLSIFCGLGGSGVAMLLDAGLKKIIGTGLISAVSCEVAGAVMSRRGGNNQRNRDVVVTPPIEQRQPQSGQGVRIARDGILVAIGTGPGSPAQTPAFNPSNSQSVRPSCMQQGMVTLENQSVGPLRVFIKGEAEPFVVLLPRESKCAPTKGEYTGEIVATMISSDGLTGRVGTAPAKPTRMPGLVLVWR